MIKNLTRALLIITVALVGPVGVIYGIFEIGDGAFSGRSNVKSIDGYYLIDYITMSATCNLLFILAFALLGWIIRGRKVQLSRIINFTTISHLFFIPSFLVSLFLTIIPVEGNIKGFIIFPTVEPFGKDLKSKLTDIADEKYIFNEFKQADGSTSRPYEGTGLGLAVTWGIIDNHDGTIKVESEIGKGSTFKFILPIQ